MSRNGDSARVDRILHECDLYKQTTGVLAALAHILEKQHAATVDIGRSVHPHADSGSDGGVVTPDIMAQGPNLNMVGEVKAAFSHRAHRKILAQLKKYDGKLTGWMIRDVPSHDLAVLTSLKNAVSLGDYLESKASDDGPALQNPWSVIEFTRMDNEDVQFFLRVARGRITNRGLAESMRRGMTVSAAEIVRQMSMFWFYDSEPPVVYTIVFLWEKILSQSLDPGAFAALGKKKIKIVTSVEQILSELGKISASMAKPKDEWVVKALDEMVRMGMAEQTGTSYRIGYYKLSGKQLLRTLAMKWVHIHPSATLTEYVEDGGRAS